MRSLQSYLEAAPKPMLRDLHTRFLGKRGLLNNSQILGDVCSYLQNSERMQQWVQSLELWQLRSIRFIYQSGSRGLEAHELLASLPTAQRNDLAAFLLSAAEQMVLWRSKTPNSYVYHGFSDFRNFFPLAPTPLAEASNLRWQDNAGMLEWHLSYTLAMAQLGRLRFNANGDLHRRSAQLCEEAFAYGARLSPSVPADELLLILQFLLDKDWLCLQEGWLRPHLHSIDFLRKSGFRLRGELLQWWVSRRLGGDQENLRNLLSACDSDQGARTVGELFWPLDPASRPFSEEPSLSWENLPRPVRELWLLGLLECHTEEGRVTRVRLTLQGREWLNGVSNPNQGTHHTCLPNFEMILSVSNGPLRLLQAACLAKVENDEPVLRFTLNRDVFLEGLRSSLPLGFDEEFLQWCGAPANVKEALVEWSAVHHSASIATQRTLKIQDAHKLAELNQFPAFLEHTLESIAGWGFVIKPGHESAIREILKHFSLEPPPDPSVSEIKILRQAEWSKQFYLPWPSLGEADYDFKPGPNREAMASAMGATKYSTEFQQLEQAKLLQVLRYAHVTETPLEAMIKDPEDRKATERTLAFTIARLQVRREPFHLEAVLSPGREVLEIPVQHIRQIRLQSV